MSVLGALLLAGLTYSVYLVYQTQAAWGQAVVQRDLRQTAVSRLRHQLGYGGLVHSYLNAILRSDKTIMNRTMLNLGAVDGALLEFRTLDKSPIEDSALAVIRNELAAMRETVWRMQTGEFNGKTPEEVYAAADVDLGRLADAVNMLVSASLGTGTGRETHLQLMSGLEGAIGLDGMIHHLKVYVLTKDAEYLQNAKADVAMALEYLQELAAAATSPAEQEAIRVISATVGKYAAGIATARGLAVQGATARQIDAAIGVDDAAALSGYTTLVSFETARLEALMQSISSDLVMTRFTLIALAFVFLVPFILQFSRVCLGLMATVPQWSETIVNIGNHLAKEEFEKSADYSSLPRELAVVEEPFTAIRRALWFRREQAQEAESQVDAMAAENEHLRTQIDKTASELKAVTRRAERASSAAAEAQGVNGMMSSVMGALSNGVLASRGLDELLFWNPRIADLTEVPLEWFSTERTLRDLILYLATRGDYGHGDPMETAKQVEQRLSSQLDEGVYSYDQTFAGTRVVALEMVCRENGTIVFSANDVTERHKHTEAMERQAVSDPLTGLANRAALNDFAGPMLKHAKRSGERAAILALDLDGFKPINDKLGHGAGDETLVELGRRLKEEIRETDFVARTGGDEFILVLLHLEDAAGAERFARRLLRAIEVPIGLSTGETVQVTGSIGVAVFPDDTEDLSKLYRKADEALYGAKAAGRNCVRTYVDVTTNLFDETGSGSA